MKPEELEDIVKRAVTAALKANPPSECLLGIDKTAHDAEHALLRQWIKVSNQIADVKWGFLTGLARSIGYGLMVLVGIGLALGLVYLTKSKTGSISLPLS